MELHLHCWSVCMVEEDRGAETNDSIIIPAAPFMSKIVRRFKIALNVKAARSCLTVCDPMHCSCQAPLSVEFSRPDYWSG